MVTLCVLSLCRLSTFVRSHRIDGKISSFATAFKITTAIWIYSLALSMPPLFGWGRYIPEVSGLGYVVISFDLIETTSKYILAFYRKYLYFYLIFIILDVPQIGTLTKEVIHMFCGSYFSGSSFQPCSSVSHLSSHASISMR